MIELYMVLGRSSCTNNADASDGDILKSKFYFGRYDTALHWSEEILVRPRKDCTNLFRTASYMYYTPIITKGLTFCSTFFRRQKIDNIYVYSFLVSPLIYHSFQVLLSPLQMDRFLFLTHWFCLMVFAFEIGLTAGAIGQQGMLTPPRQLIPPPVFLGVRVSPFVYLTCNSYLNFETDYS
jgi:hypothetical protein